MILTVPIRQTSKGTPRDLTSLLSMLSQGFGEHPEIYGPKYGLKGHNGLDWPCAEGTPVYAAHDGRVTFAGTDSDAGKGIVIDGTECKTIYWHLSTFLVPQGTPVKAGEIVGSSGNTGFSTGPHLHFGLKMLYNGTVKDRNNGYDGAVDPTPYLSWTVTGNTMTEQEVRQLQALEGYHDEDGVRYWTGKPLSEYLKARLQDKVKVINETL